MEAPNLKPPVDVKFTDQERNASDWNIQEGEETELYCRHISTAKVFRGTMKEFNKAIRG